MRAVPLPSMSPRRREFRTGQSGAPGEVTVDIESQPVHRDAARDADSIAAILRSGRSLSELHQTPLRPSTRCVAMP